MTSRIALALGFLVSASLGCDSNLFSSFEDANTPEAHAEEGRLALDRGDFNQAIVELEAAVDQDPSDVSYKADLASAYSGRGGLAFVRLAYNLQSTARDSNTDQDFLRNITTEDKMPRIDGDTLADLTRAIAILNDDIREEQATQEIRLQRAIVQLAHAGTTPLVFGDLNRDRQLDANEMIRVNDDAYVDMLNDMRAANREVQKVAAGNPDFKGFTDRVDSALRQVDSMPGLSDAERVRMYVSEQYGIR